MFLALQRAPRWLLRLLTVLLALNLADWLTTLIGLREGHQELNAILAPLFAAPLGWPALLFKLAAIAIFAVVCYGALAHLSPQLIRLALIGVDLLGVLILCVNWIDLLR